MSEWKTVRLGDVFELQMGKTPDRKRLDYFKGSHKWISIADISKSEKYISETKESLTDDAISSSGIKIIPKDTVIMSFKLTIGKTAITSNEMYSNEAIMAFLPNKKYETDNSFLYHLFSNKNWSEGSNKAVKGITLNKASLSEMTILLPPLETQKQIAAVLDKCTSLILKYKKILEKYDTLIKSRFIEMFGDLKQNSKNWQIKNFAECAKIDTNMVKDFEKYADYPHIGIDSIEKETGKLSGYRTVKEDNVISGKYFFTPEHIIYSKIRPNLNKVAMPNFNGVCSADAYPILVDKDVCSKEFFTYVLRSDYYLSYILAFSSRTNMPKVNKEQVESFYLPVPPIFLQNTFAAFVQQVDKSKFEIEKIVKMVYN